MSFLPSTVEIEETEQATEYIDFVLDKESNQFVYIGTQLQSLAQWVETCLKTPRYKYPIFSYYYGCEIESLIGESKTKEELKELVEYYIIDCLKANQFIDEVQVSDIEIDDTNISAKIYVKDIYGRELNYEYQL